ncbi:hypothetical protein [Brucella cytisi]|uniref:Uncharacterized protein n=1 Tax=Brucella cytisi TaxID=407152 RepID=A0A1J6I6W5_9HYPH|nr:hypothetical protein [Brucella cytisi]KIU66079.1 hypothetical protein TR92_19955 [Brucella anthropi]OIS90704.1 hypothetical protein BLA27_25090 [Brucella cytisi]
MKILAIAAVGVFMVSGTAFASAPALSTVKQTIKQDQASGPVVAGGSGKQNRVGLPGTGKSFRF